MNIYGKNAGGLSVRDDLTIVVPAFQCAPYLSAAIESALHSHPAQVLVTTDGGGLEVARVAARYQRDYPDRVRVLQSRRRRGVALNLNHAVTFVTTPFFAKLDGDDVLFPGHLEAALQLFENRPSLAIVAGRERRIATDDHLAFHSERIPAYEPDPSPKVLSGTEAFRFIVTWDPNPCSSGCIYRTDAFLQAGGFDPSIPWGEDWEIWLRFARQGEVAFCDAPSALYRIHPQSTTSRQSADPRLCFGYDAVFRRAAFLCLDPELAPLLRRSFARVASMYLRAAVCQTATLRPSALACWQGAARALANAFFLPGDLPDRSPASLRGPARASVGIGHGGSAGNS
jgi:hypothetical protein